MTTQLVGENGKTYKYEFKGKGYNTKQTLHFGMVTHYLDNRGFGSLKGILEEAGRKVNELYPEDSDEKNLKRIHTGFRNSQDNEIQHDLEEVSNSLTGKGKVELVAYIFGAGGRPYVQAYKTLFRKDLNQNGLAVIGDKLSEVDVPFASDERGIMVEKEDKERNQYSDNVKATISTDPLA